MSEEVKEQDDKKKDLERQLQGMQQEFSQKLAQLGFVHYQKWVNEAQHSDLIKQLAELDKEAGQKQQELKALTEDAVQVQKSEG